MRQRLCVEWDYCQVRQDARWENDLDLAAVVLSVLAVRVLHLPIPADSGPHRHHRRQARPGTSLAGGERRITMLPPELTVTIRNIGDDEYLAVTERARGQEVCQNTFHCQTRPLGRPGAAVAAGQGRAAPRLRPGARARPGDAARLEEEDRTLADLRPTPVRLPLRRWHQDLRAFLEFNDAYRRQARLTLALHGKPRRCGGCRGSTCTTATSSWPCTGRFLLSRPSLRPGRTRPRRPWPLPLRILVVISSPDDQNPLDTEEEIASSSRRWTRPCAPERVQVEYLDDATLEAVGEALRRFRPHVLHYTGHGQLRRGAGAAAILALETDAGETQTAGIDRAAPPPAAGPRPAARGPAQRLPDRADQRPSTPFSGVATGLLHADIPAVLAMQFSILDASGIRPGAGVLRQPGPRATA